MSLNGFDRVALPGLIDCHLNVCGVYIMDQPAIGDLFGVPWQVLKNLRALVESGVTTARDMAGPLNIELWLRALARNGWIASPRLLVPGPILTAPGGYPMFFRPIDPPLEWITGQLKAEVRDAAHAGQWVESLAKSKMDFIKAAYTSADYSDRNLMIFIVSMGIAGFMLYGPDSLLSGVGAIDVGSKKGAGPARQDDTRRDKSRPAGMRQEPAFRNDSGDERG